MLSLTVASFCGQVISEAGRASSPTNPSCLLSNTNLKDLETIASRTAAEHGIELCRVQLLAHLIPMTIQVQIRHIDGDDVSLDDCAHFSTPLGEAIEESELFNKAYVLEVSSPGISDELKTDREFQTFKGFPVEVNYKGKNDLDKNKSGLLKERSLEHVQLNIKGRITNIPRESVINVRLISPTD